MTERELFEHICRMVPDRPAKGLQPPYTEVAIPLHPDTPVDYERVCDAACATALGPSDFVYHPSVGAPHIDAYRYPPADDRSCWCYVTNGMSDFPLQLPDGGYFRMEILAATSTPDPVVPEFLRVLGQVPFATSTFLHCYHTVPFPQGILVPDQTFALLIPPFLAPDLHQFELLPTEPVVLLQVIGITGSERALAVRSGGRKLVEEHLPDRLSTWLLDSRGRSV